MAGEAWRIIDPLPGRTDEPINYPGGSWGPAEADRLAAIGRWYQPLEAAQ